MRTKLLLVVTLLIVCCGKLHAQSQSELDVTLSAHIRRSLSLIGNDNLKRSALLLEFYIAAENEQVVMYKWHQDSTVYIAFSIKPNKVVQSVIVSVPNHYAAMIKDFLFYRGLRLQSGSTMDGYDEYYSEDNTAFMRTIDDGQTIMLTIISNYFR